MMTVTLEGVALPNPGTLNLWAHPGRLVWRGTGDIVTEPPWVEARIRDDRTGEEIVISPAQVNTYTDDLYATRLLRELEAQCNPRPDIGLLILVSYALCFGLFVYWIAT